MCRGNRILYIGIENSLESLVPTAEFEILDSTNVIANRLSGQNCRIYFLISCSLDDTVKTLELTFIVKDYRIVDMTTDSLIWRVMCELDTAIPMNTVCEYATASSLDKDEETLENPYKIARDILLQAGYNMFPLTSIDENGKEVDTRYSLPYTDEYCRFITTPNMLVKNALQYLLSYGIGESGLNSPAYFIHRLTENKGYITSFENIFKPESLAMMKTQRVIPISISEGLIKDREFVARRPQIDSFEGGIENAKKFFNYRFAEYNQEERTWEAYNVNKLVLNSLLTKGIDSSNETSIFMNTLNEDLSLSKYYKYVPHSHPVLYDMMRALELYSSSFSFVIDGNLEFDVGDVIDIQENGVDGSKEVQFSGRWAITTIKHSFRNATYYNYITACRRFKTIHTPTYDNTEK